VRESIFHTITSSEFPLLTLMIINFILWLVFIFL